MQDYQIRVIDEKNDLDKKISKYSDFFETQVFHNLDNEERTRLRYQLYWMKGYSKVLGERIAAFR